MPISKSTAYYRSHPEARVKKTAYNKKLNKRRDQVKKRVEANKARREAKNKGLNIVGKDYDHRVNAFVPSSVNRGRSGEGGRKKGVPHNK